MNSYAKWALFSEPVTIINDYIKSGDVLEMEDARTEYGLPKILVKPAHVYTADTRLSSSSPPCALLESLGMRLGSAQDFWSCDHKYVCKVFRLIIN